MKMRRYHSTGHGNFGQNIGLRYSCAQEEEYRLYAENNLSEAVGKLSHNASISVTTAKIFILEMIKAVLNADIL